MKRKTLNRLGVFFLVLAIVFSIAVGIGEWRLNDEEYWHTIYINIDKGDWRGITFPKLEIETMKAQLQNIIYLLVIPMVLLYTLAIICLYSGLRKFKQERL